MKHILYIASGMCAVHKKCGLATCWARCLSMLSGKVSGFGAGSCIADRCLLPKGDVLLGSKTVQLSWRKQYAGLYKLQRHGVYYFIDNEYRQRGAFGGQHDDGECFAFFSKAALELLPLMDPFPDLLHCNDWQTALVPIYLKTLYRERGGYRNLPVVFTIHNIEYQGKFDHFMLADVLGIPESSRSLLDLHGALNYMKGAIVSCDALTTVSPTYAREIRYPFFGQGLEHIIGENEYKLTGILNGIDTECYDPGTDPHLAANYTAEDMAPKRRNKQALSDELGLRFDENTPMLGMVTRLVAHKGPDLLMGVFEDMMALDLTLVILGTGDAKYENWLRESAKRYPGKFHIVTAFSPGLASRIYGGADFFLMPSVSEPCGLAQMIALRYGTIPIVRNTGGLADTVQAFSGCRIGKRHHIQTVNAHDMLDAVRRGLAYYKDPTLRKKSPPRIGRRLQLAEVGRDYIALYDRLTAETHIRKDINLMKLPQTAAGIREEIRDKLQREYGRDSETATPRQVYRAVCSGLRDIMTDLWMENHCDEPGHEEKEVIYLSMEFLPGTSLRNNLFNLGLADAFRDALGQIGFDLETLQDMEPDADWGTGAWAAWLPAIWMPWLPRGSLVTGCRSAMNTEYLSKE